VLFFTSRTPSVMKNVKVASKNVVTARKEATASG
jgi:hypothetical protein